MSSQSDYDLPDICLCFSKEQQVWPNPENSPQRAFGYCVGPYVMERENKQYQAIRVSFVYCCNPGYKILGQRVGDHINDTESLIFLFDATSKELAWVYLSAHSIKEGTWCRPHELKREPTKQAILVYVSPTSHAMYPRAGRYLRLFGFANDVTRDDIRVQVNDFETILPNSMAVRKPNLNPDKLVVPKPVTMNAVERFLGGYIPKW